MAKAKHAPLHYATYRGPDDVGYAGQGAHRRGYPAGQTIQIGQDDVTAIRALLRRKDNEHVFELDRVPTAIIGTAEEAQPTEATDAIKRNELLASLEDA
jgi:hypothetical protein